MCLPPLHPWGHCSLETLSLGEVAGLRDKTDNSHLTGEYRVTEDGPSLGFGWSLISKVGHHYSDHGHVHLDPHPGVHLMP